MRKGQRLSVGVMFSGSPLFTVDQNVAGGNSIVILPVEYNCRCFRVADNSTRIRGIVVRLVLSSFIALIVISGVPSVAADQTSALSKECSWKTKFISSSLTPVSPFSRKEGDAFFIVCEMQFNADVSFLL
jgi:hypothetical protein